MFSFPIGPSFGSARIFVMTVSLGIAGCFAAPDIATAGAQSRHAAISIPGAVDLLGLDDLKPGT